MQSLETLEQQLRRKVFCLPMPSEAEVRTKAAVLTHHPNANPIQDFEPLTHRKKSINLPVLVQNELEVLKSAGRGASHLSLPFPNPGTWMPGHLPTTAPKPKAVVQL